MTGDTAGRANDQILRLLINERPAHPGGSRAGASRSPTRTSRNAVNEIESRNGLQPGGLRENLRRGNIDPRVLYDQIRAQIGWNRLLRGLLGDQAKHQPGGGGRIPRRLSGAHGPAGIPRLRDLPPDLGPGAGSRGAALHG
jgi:hypothetical protein